MRENIKQHYVPKFYLKNFTNHGLFNVFILNSMEIKKNISYNTQCYDKYFYGKDLKIEKEFAVKETRWSNIIRKIISNETIDERDKESIKEFALYQYVRTQAFNYEMGIRERMIFDQYYQNIGIKDERIRTALYYRYIHDKKEEDPYNEKVNISIIDKYNLLNKLTDKDILVKTYFTKTKFITSDAPVILYNQIDNSSIGLNERDLIIIIPLCQNVAMFIYNKDAYPKYQNFNYVNTNIEGEVCKINSFEYIIAKDYVYGTSEILEADLENCKNERQIYYKQPHGYVNENGTNVVLRHIEDDFLFDL